MADKTMGFKITEEMHEKTKKIIEESGYSAKEWLEKAVALYQVQQMKDRATEFTSDLNELEHHTQRIYTLVANMMERAGYLRAQAIEDSTELVKQKDRTIADLQKQVQEKESAVASISTQYDELNATIDELEAKNKELAGTMGDKQALIQTYTEKIAQLEAEVSNLKGLRNDMALLKQEHTHDIADFKKEQKALQQELQNAYQANHDLEHQLEAIEATHAKDIELVRMQVAAEKNNELVAMSREHQQEINRLHTTYNERIQQLLATKNDEHEKDEV